MLAAVPAGAQVQPGVHVIGFPGGFNLPLWLAEADRVEGPPVRFTPTPDSATQMRALIEGRCDAALTALDNVVAYRQRGADLVATLVLDGGFLAVAAAREVESLAALRGREVSVDAPDTGYAFVLYEALARAGLPKGSYGVVQAGGVLQRFEALARGDHAATLLVAPFDVTAEARGLRVLARGNALPTPYAGYSLAVRRDRLDDPALRDLARMLRAGLRTLGAPDRDRTEARAAALLIERGGLPPVQAARAAARLLDRRIPNGFAAGDGPPDLAAVRTVLDLRARHTGTAPDAPETYLVQGA